ncbi:hypothetical protein PAHAL_9G044200 [Panicum hallii]|uniref:Rieske domain-containing protein n=1 Tax=Panicum hallii TaxID=206008 RepID=A0A2T8I030_9POAL|nr:hypothetical protein PAHAL_9G044200 [Panicum hallii]
MDPLSLLLLPRASRPFGTTAVSLRSAGLGGARVVHPRRRRHGAGRRLSTVSVAALGAPRAEQAPVPAEKQFDWLDQWYPLAPVGELDPRAPHGSASASSPGTTAAPARGACSTTPARTASRRSPRAASTARAASSACTTAGASTAPAPASSSPRPPPSAPRRTGTAGRARRRTPAWSRTKSCGSTRGRRPSTRTCCGSEEEAPAVLRRDRRPVVAHRVRHKGFPLRVRHHDREPHRPCSCPIRAQGDATYFPQRARSRKS